MPIKFGLEYHLILSATSDLKRMSREKRVQTKRERDAAIPKPNRYLSAAAAERAMKRAGLDPAIYYVAEGCDVGFSL